MENLILRVSGVKNRLILVYSPCYVREVLLAGSGTSGYLRWLALSPQPLVECLNSGVVAGSTQRCQVQRRARSLLTTPLCPILGLPLTLLPD
jgi:hypothetical protein